MKPHSDSTPSFPRALMATAAGILRLARCRRAAVAQTLHRCATSLLPPLSSAPPRPPAAVDHAPLSSSVAPWRLRSLPFTSAAPEEGVSNDLYGRPDHAEMKKGDWICDRCNFMNFARNFQCLRCRAEGPRRASYGNVEMRKGDWNCPGCGFMNFARNTSCLRCRVIRPGYDAADNFAMNNGNWSYPDADRAVRHGNSPFRGLDWNCPKCQFLNFARNSACFRCEEPRPSMQLMGGEWECPSCKFLNFRRNTTCFNCHQSQPSDITIKQGDGLLNTPKMAAEDTWKEVYGDSGNKDEDIDPVIGDLKKDEDTDKP